MRISPSKFISTPFSPLVSFLFNYTKKNVMIKTNKCCDTAKLACIFVSRDLLLCS